MSSPYPTALSRLTSPDSFESASIANLTGRHLRHLIGSDIVEATPVDDAAIAEHWVQFYVDRILSKRDTVTIIDGEPGEGKSNFALWLGAKVRDRLGLETGGKRTLDLEQDIVYRLTTFTARVYRSSRENPSVIIADEGVLVGAQGSSGLSDSGRILDRILSVGRIQGCTIFLLNPNVWGLASFVRNRRAKVLMHVEHRGDGPEGIGVTTVFTLKTSMDFLPPRQLPFKKAHQPWSKLRWPSLELDPIWKKYEPNKIETTKQTMVDSAMEAARLEKKAGMRPPGPEWMDYWEGNGRGEDDPATRGDFLNARAHTRVAKTKKTPAPPHCRKCGRGMPGEYQLRQHEAVCKGRAKAAP